MKPKAKLCACGEVFTATNPRQTKCRKDCGRTRIRPTQDRNRTRKERARTNRHTFVGVDGEGVDRAGGAHEYVLLCVGNRALHNPKGQELGLEQIFAFLYESFELTPTATYVGFFLSYDFAQWFKHLPLERARKLFTNKGIQDRQRKGPNPTPLPVQWKGWEFDLLAERRFKLRPQQPKAKWMYICDAGPFYQTSFLNVIKPEAWPEHEQVCTPQEYETILKGKENRSDNQLKRGTPVPQETIDYCRLENEVFSRVMTRLNEGLVKMDVKLNRRQWFGPGQAASAWLTNIIPHHQGQDIRNVTPTEVLEAARDSYLGGWFELMRHGTFKEAYEYDINSAYPATIAELPCLIHGQWKHNDPQNRGDITLLNVTVKGSDPHIGALMHRRHNGAVNRPHNTRGWHWRHELDAAIEAGLVDTYEIHESWDYHKCACPPPLQTIADLYKQRQQAKAEAPGGSEEKTLKLVYNSSYGKIAQSIGSPRWANPIWASLVTTGCRTAITKAIATHPHRTRHVIMVATDGVYFLTPHDDLDIGPGLGQWDGVRKEQFTVFKPGVHWYQPPNGTKGLKSRGVSASGIKPHLETIQTLWEQWDGQWPWPNLKITVPFGIISPRLAIHRNDWNLAGKVIVDIPIAANSTPFSKRTCGWADPDPEHGAWISRPHQYGDPGSDQITSSTPYARNFGLDDEPLTGLQGVVHPTAPYVVLYQDG